MSDWKWKTRDGIELFSRSWESPKEAKAVICLIHGLGEHTGRYDHVGKALSEGGFELHGFDLRGHGRSQGPLGHTPSYQSLMDDITDFLELLDDRCSGKPVFLYGHSLGANLVINHIIREKPTIQGGIATDPWLELNFQPPAIKVMLARVMNAVLPGFAQSNELDTSALSRDPAIEQAYVSDPLVHDRISARLFLETYQAGLWAMDNASNFPLPLLLMHGTADRICSIDASRLFVEQNPGQVDGVFLDGWYHEVHNEPGSDQVFSRMIQWLDEKL
ncbi:alpha/beta hydrolase [Chloroflexota bacterium]